MDPAFKACVCLSPRPPNGGPTDRGMALRGATGEAQCGAERASGINLVDVASRDDVVRQVEFERSWRASERNSNSSGILFDQGGRAKEQQVRVAHE